MSAVPTTERTTSGLMRASGFERLRVERLAVGRLERALLGRVDGARAGLRAATA
jgi:hypothetical protein